MRTSAVQACSVTCKLLVFLLVFCRSWHRMEASRCQDCAGYGSCDEPQQHGEFTSVRCLGPEEQLKPGQVRTAWREGGI